MYPRMKIKIEGVLNYATPKNTDHDLCYCANNHMLRRIEPTQEHISIGSTVTTNNSCLHLLVLVEPK